MYIYSMFENLVEEKYTGKNNKFNKPSCDIISNKICNNCKIEKSASEFKLRKLSSGRKTLNHICKSCGALKARKLRSNPIYKANEHKQQKLRRRENPEKEMLHRAEVRAIKLNLDFNLKLSDIIIPEICPLLEIPLIMGDNKAFDNSPSLDRINPKLGYIKGNVKVISRMANIMKAHATKEQIFKFHKNIQCYFPGEV